MGKHDDEMELNAVNLKSELWKTLRDLRSGAITPGSADAIAAQAREILRTARTQLAVFAQANVSVSNELIDFAKPTGGK